MEGEALLSHEEQLDYDDDDHSNMTSSSIRDGLCEHIIKLDPDKVRLLLELNTTRKSCIDQTKENLEMTCAECDLNERTMLWRCLFCDYVGCGRYSQQQHSLNHYEQTRRRQLQAIDMTEKGYDEVEESSFMEDGHTLVVNLVEKILWCYACDRPWNMNMIQTCRLEESMSCCDMITLLGDMMAFKTSDDLLPVEAAENPNLSETLSNESASSSDEISTISTPPSRDELRQNAAGLQNLGNTCYMNAALQALSHCEPMVYFFRECHGFTEITGSGQYLTQLSDSFRGMIELLWTGEYTYVKPAGLIRQVKTVLPNFRGFAQHDAQEFLRCFLDRLHEELKLSTVPLWEQQEETKKHMPTLDRTATKSSEEMKSKKFMSFVSDVFEGVLRSQVRCANCHHNSIKDDPFSDLSLSITRKIRQRGKDKGSFLDGEEILEQKTPGILGTLTNSILSFFGLNTYHMKLQDCLENFCSEEELTGSDQYKCEKCNALYDCTKSIRILQLPEILCVHLKRFRYDSFFSNKIGAQVNFPLKELDMGPYCLNTKDLKPTHYNLFALISHRGGLHGGHYVTYAKSPVNHCWYEFDDAIVTKKTETDLAQVEAYMLFYRRVSSTKQELERQKILELIQSLSNDENQPICLISKLWMTKWLFCTSPGPICNGLYLCEHQGVNTRKFKNCPNLMTSIPESVFHQLAITYGSDLKDILKEPLACRKCEAYEKSLDIRRKMEEKDVAALDVITISAGQFWYLIHSDWLRRWNEFKNDGTLPGPISNHSLLDEHNRPLEHLRKAFHYRGVNKQVWEYFHKHYGGGPAIIRDTIDIYAPSCEDTPPPVS